MDLLSMLSPILAGAGPWGALIGAGLTLLVQYLRSRKPANPAPAPAPTVPVPAPVTPTPTDPQSALLAALMSLLAPAQAPAVPATPPAAPTGPAIAPEHRGPLIDLILKALGK